MPIMIGWGEKFNSFLVFRYFAFLRTCWMRITTIRIGTWHWPILLLLKISIWNCSHPISWYRSNHKRWDRSWREASYLLCPGLSESEILLQLHTNNRWWKCPCNSNRRIWDDPRRTYSRCLEKTFSFFFPFIFKYHFIVYEGFPCMSTHISSSGNFYFVWQGNKDEPRVTKFVIWLYFT